MTQNLLHNRHSSPIKSTIIPIILTSDKTPVTHQTGGLEMHPVFLTIRNIQSDIWMQVTSHAWHCIAFIPSPDFNIHTDFRTILLAHVFHWSLDVVTASLKAAAKDGTSLIDPCGNIRNCYMPLIAYIADLPEQQLIMGVSRNASPVTMAKIPQFGDPTPAAPQMHKKILCLIQEVCRTAHPWDLIAFQKAAKSLKLLGIHLPFWHNWMFSDPEYFLNGEILHSGHKFFFDHVLSWCKVVAGSSVLNTCFSSLHQCVSFCHFSSGVSRPLQMTRRDHHDIQRMIVPILDGAGTITDGFICAICALVKFIYHAQDPVHTNSLIAAMEQALMNFHSTKQSILDLQARKGSSGVINHFRIPKLELMLSFGQQIKANGTLMQYSAEVPECLLITHCKTPFQQTSHNTHTYADQVVEILNHEETMRWRACSTAERTATNIVIAPIACARIALLLCSLCSCSPLLMLALLLLALPLLPARTACSHAAHSSLVLPSLVLPAPAPRSHARAPFARSSLLGFGAALGHFRAPCVCAIPYLGFASQRLA